MRVWLDPDNFSTVSHPFATVVDYKTGKPHAQIIEKVWRTCEGAEFRGYRYFLIFTGRF
jgi:hypothetical protein